MKSFLLLLVIFVFAIKPALSQSTAADFTANDCNGNSLNLFSELNSGKVVVLSWVMPCGACINDARGAYDAAQTFATSHPGKVVYYMADDFGNTNCSTLSTWANANGIKPNVTLFGNAGVAIDENNYGGTGMPHVVVIGPDKKIYFNVRNGSGNFNAIKEAISLAITSTGIGEVESPATKLAVYPNPATDILTIKYELPSLSETRFTILNSLGQIISTEHAAGIQSGEQEIKLDVSTLNNGVYCLRLNTGNSEQVVRFIVSR